MGRDDWFRRTTWTERDAEEFQARLKRCRGDGSKAQYLYVQAYHLAEAGNHEAALALLDQQLRDYPGAYVTTPRSLIQRAESLDALDRADEAIAGYRDALKAREDAPNVLTGVEPSFAWFIIVRKLAPLYDEALRLLEDYESGPGGSMFPVERFRVAVIRALIAWEREEVAAARRFADLARREAAMKHSGLRYHPDVGLVEGIDPQVAARLAVIPEIEDEEAE